MVRFAAVENGLHQSALPSKPKSEASHYGPKDQGKEQPKEKKDKFSFNKVENVTGSTAGAGSGEFHMYRAARRREMERVSAMEKEHKKTVEEQEFQEMRKRAQEEVEMKSQQKAAKRRRKQENAKMRKMMGGQDGKSSNGDEDEAPPALDGVMPGGVPEIANDGTFLEKLLERQKQEQVESKDQDDA
ncbi:Aste57867_21539 [Aphanomyces stellatus]|uniref:Aste57867_21539 protein n=1 Tax=Aphanomyces stellatus TaxID=120398 RepID=A0A485LJV8_9STRA|nr:hypothetical protein As57867_021470 [Aphanomyces stellatus]VFT98209.1 Aste57867_21539 [Aphanomyces stellatus]